MRNTFAVALGACVVISLGELATTASAQANDGQPPPTQAASVQDASAGRHETEANSWRFTHWPVLIEDPEGVFLYATRGATNVGISPFQNNLAIGFHTLNPTIHRSSACNSFSGFDGFCGDEVAYGDFTLGHDVSGRDNTAIGDHALANLRSGVGNTAVGSSAAANIHAAAAVDAFGVAACEDATDYRGPITCIGQAALKSAGPRSQYTVALGYQAGLHTTAAEFSTILGMEAGFDANFNSHSILVGEGACHNASSISNVICIGTINGPDRGNMSDRLWVGGNNGAVPILYGDLRINAVGLNTTKLMSGAALTVAGGNLALPAGYSVQWNGDAGISRAAAGKLAVGNGVASNASGALELSRIILSSKTTLGASTTGELDIRAGDDNRASGHIVSAYSRTVPTTVANLSAIDPSPDIGDRAFVTDAANCAFGVFVASGGSAKCPVYYDGTSWVAG